MPLLPLRVLPVNDAHDGPFTMRVNVKPSGSVYVYVRRESDKKTWLCTVRTLQEILAPSQQARSMDFVAVMMCLYHGIAYDASAAASAPVLGATYSTGPVELRRREVAFSQPDSWPDDGYRLTMRVSVRSSSIATPIAHAVSHDDPPLAAIPVVDVAEDDVVFGLNFASTVKDLEYAHTKLPKFKNRCASLQATATAFPNTYIQWREYRDTDFLRVVNDGVYYTYDGVGRFPDVHGLDIHVEIVHAKDAGAPLFVLSVNDKTAVATHATSYTVGDLHHTIALYTLRVAARSFVQVVMLPGSACAVAGTTITFREMDR